MLVQPNAHLPWQGPRFTGSVYLNVDNVDELWESRKTRARVVYPIETTEYGVREFGLLDDNDYQSSLSSILQRTDLDRRGPTIPTVQSMQRLGANSSPD